MEKIIHDSFNREAVIDILKWTPIKGKPPGPKETYHLKMARILGYRQIGQREIPRYGSMGQFDIKCEDLVDAIWSGGMMLSRLSSGWRLDLVHAGLLPTDIKVAAVPNFFRPGPGREGTPVEFYGIRNSLTTKSLPDSEEGWREVDSILADKLHLTHSLLLGERQDFYTKPWIQVGVAEGSGQMVRTKNTLYGTDLSEGGKIVINPPKRKELWQDGKLLKVNGKLVELESIPEPVSEPVTNEVLAEKIDQVIKILTPDPGLDQ